MANDQINRKPHLRIIPGIAVLLLFLDFSCLAPWWGEERNPPVVALEVLDAQEDILPVSELQISSIHHMETGIEVPLGLDTLYDSRLDSGFALTLPLDLARDISTFVIRRDTLFDTLEFHYTSHRGVDPQWEYNQIIDSVYLGRHSLDSVFEIEEVNHPKVFLRISAQL